MGEFMERIADGERIKVGTCEDLYYLRADQLDQVRYCGDADVAKHLGEYRFRFPFPDEDGEEPGGFGDPFRSVVIPGYEPESDYPLEKPAVAPIKIVQQGHREGELRTIVRDSGGEHDHQHQLFQLSNREALRAVERLLDAAEDGGGGHYVEIAKRVLAGYNTKGESA